MKQKYKAIGILLVGIILLIVYLCGGIDNLNKNNDEVIFVGEDDINEETEVASLNNEKIVVDIKGEVKNPNIYWLDEGSIVEDLIFAAGGITEEGDLNNINRAEELSNHQSIIIPNINDAEAQQENILSVSGNNNEDIININTASISELDTLPGIGAAKAESIINYREENGKFKTIEEIKNVSGIGEGVFEKIKNKIKT